MDDPVTHRCRCATAVVNDCSLFVFQFLTGTLFETWKLLNFGCNAIFLIFIQVYE